MTINQIKIDENGNARIMLTEDGKLRMEYVRLGNSDELNLLLTLVEKKLASESSEQVKEAIKKDRLERFAKSRKEGREAADKERLENNRP